MRGCCFHTVSGVEGHLHLPLLRPQQRLGHLGHGGPPGARAVQEAAGARLLHDLATRVPAHGAEGVVAEDDGAVLHARIGNDELPVLGEEEEFGERWVGRG